LPCNIPFGFSLGKKNSEIEVLQMNFTVGQPQQIFVADFEATIVLVVRFKGVLVTIKKIR